MSTKIIIVGGVAGGASTAARLRRLDEDAEITIMEKGEYISFANCGLPYHIGGIIEKRESLLVQTPQSMSARFDITIKVKNEVISIDREKRKVQVKDLETNYIYWEDYDYLVLSPGAAPIKPPIEGINSTNVYTLRTIPDTDQIKGFVDNNQPARAVVVGGGFIGIEMAENLAERGIKVSLVELAEQVMSPLDIEMASLVHNHLRTKGIDLHLKNGIDRIERERGKTRVVLQNGIKLETEIILLALGVRPNVDLAKKAGLELGKYGIRVNQYLQTSDQRIYAIGDAIEVTNLVTGQPSFIPLAGPANKQGRIAANNINGLQEKYEGTLGTSIAKVFDYSVATTGVNEKQLKKAGIDYRVSYTDSNNHAGYYPGAKPMMIKIIFTPDEGRLLGAQIVGYQGVDKRIDLLATAIRQKMTVLDLQELELAYAPPFGSAKDPVNMAAYTAGNILDGLVEPIQWHQLESLPEDTILLDVREQIETAFGMIEGAVNIPLNSLRDRMDELDKEKEIVVYCAVGLRGYLGCRILMQHGFNRVKNLSGGYKLYNAVKHDRQQIVERPDEAELTSISNPEEGKLVGRKIASEREV